MDTKTFGELLQNNGFVDFVGVPCSYLAPLINYAIMHERFIMANNEGDAMAIASGISLVGAKETSRNYGVVLMQNSGLSNALSPLTSLNHTFGIPVLGFVSLRGERDINNQNTDEPQHELLGVITDKLLEVCGVEYAFLSADFVEASKQILEAKKILQNNKSFFFIVKNGVLESLKLENQKEIFLKKSPFLSVKLEAKYTRLEILEAIVSLSKNMITLATTGKSGRELYEIKDCENHLYMVGSMGCVSALGLGISLKSDKKILCIDGDGALLMRMGTLSTNAYYTKMHNKGNFCHILLDNESHDSTGGQFSLAPCVDFTSIAHACGYEKVLSLETLDSLKDALEEFEENKSGGATFIYMKIKKGSKKDLGRPKITPYEVARRIERIL